MNSGKTARLTQCLPQTAKLARGTARELVPQDAKLIHLYPAQLAVTGVSIQLLFRRFEPYLGRMPLPPAEALIELKEKYPDIAALAFLPDTVRPAAKITVEIAPAQTSSFFRNSRKRD